MKKSCVFTVDWEDFGQLTTKYRFNKITSPKNDIERQTNIILQTCNDYNIKGTFFVLGITAKYRPDLVRLIYQEGHEIALHGFFHEALNTISYKRIYNDILESKKLVEDIIGSEIFGYRAPFFSLTRNRLKTLELLSELGFIYDSSIFPAFLSKIGISNFSPKNAYYELANKSKIVELPLSTVGILNTRFSLSGGSYMRLLPQPLIVAFFRRIERNLDPGMIYLHPYEFDNKKIKVESNYPEFFLKDKIYAAIQNLRWNLNKNSIENKIKYLFSEYKFTSCKDVASIILENPPILLDY